MDDVSANPVSGSDADPVALIEQQLEREVTPTPTKRVRSAAPEPTEQQPEQPPEQPETEEEVPAEEDGEQTEDPESEEGEETDDQPAEPQEELFTVKAGGSEIQVNRDELIKGYQRLSDYSRNIQAVAEQRKAVEAEQARIASERAHYSQQLEQVAGVLRAALPPEPDWDRLAKEDPAGYVRHQHEYQSHVGRLQAVMAEQQRVAQLQEQHGQQTRQQMMAAAAERLVELIPEWKEPEKAAKEKREIADYLRSIGYQDEEIGQASDPRAILMARKAREYDRLMASKETVKAKVAAAPRTVKAGVAPPPPNKAKQLAQRLKQSGGRDLDAAAALIEMG